MKRILYDEVDRIGIIRLNDPQRLNAMGEEMAADLRALVDRLRPRPPRVLILTGEGRAFSAGGDLEMLERKRSIGVEDNRHRMLEFYRSYLDLLELEVPLVAAVNGHAVGAGLILACACDLRVADPEARFSVPFARLGLHPGMGATYFIPRVVGAAVATDLLLTGLALDASQALRAGLVSRVSAPGACLEEARKAARGILAGGPAAVRRTLLSLRSPSLSLDQALHREARAQADCYASAEFEEGLRAAFEKRPPRFGEREGS